MVSPENEKAVLEEEARMQCAGVPPKYFHIVRIRRLSYVNTEGGLRVASGPPFYYI